MNVIAIPLDRKRIRVLANSIREIIKELYDGEFKLLDFVENNLSVLDKEYNFAVIPIEEMPGVYGRTNASKSELFIREDVYEGIRQENPRDLFTLAHELAHYLLHGSDKISFARGNVSIKCDPEWQANTFASELLKPYFEKLGIDINYVINA